MITPEEWKTLKVGNVVYYVYKDERCVFTGRVKNCNQADFDDGYCNLNDENVFINKIDALKELKGIINDEIDELERQVRSIDDQIKQLEQENGE